MDIEDGLPERVAPVVAKVFRYAVFALQMGFAALWFLLLAISFQNRDCQWSLVQTALYSIPMDMHGGVVFLSARQKFIYYDAYSYCWMLGVALGCVMWPVGWLRRANTTPLCVLAIIVALSAVTYATAVVVANLGPDVTRLHLPGITP
jgi:hypothetical protein